MGIGVAERRFGVCGGVEMTNGAEAGSTDIGDFRLLVWVRKDGV